MYGVIYCGYSGADTKKLNANQQSCLHLAAEMNKIAALEVMAKFRTILDPNLPGGNRQLLGMLTR